MAGPGVLSGVSILTLCFLLRSLLATSDVVYVDGINGKDTKECLSLGKLPCSSLSYVSENLIQRVFVRIEVLGSILNLTTAVNFTDYTNLSIIYSFGVINCNETNAGLGFFSVSNLTLRSLTIKNCGALRPSTILFRGYQQDLPVALYVLNSTNVSIEGVNILLSKGRGISLYDTNGRVDIINSNFIRNIMFCDPKSGGGGMHIEFTTCSSVTSIHQCIGQNQHSSFSVYNIKYCNFTNNIACSDEIVDRFLPPSQEDFGQRLGGGGGLYISIGSNATNNTFNIDSCNFNNNTATFDGGGMMLVVRDTAVGNSINVTQTIFEENTCTNYQSSTVGGLFIGFKFYSHSTGPSKSRNNSFQCYHCQFRNNHGHIGGGTGIFSTKTVNQLSLSTVSFINCQWVENESAMGAAVFITPDIWDYSREGFTPVPVFTNCSFRANTATKELKQSQTESCGVYVNSVGFGALFASQTRVTFKGNTTFESNHGSGVHLSNSIMEFIAGSEVTFKSNTAQNGGAIAMYGTSAILIDNSSSLLYENNTAHSKGGAIYYSFNAATHPAYHNCFISTHDFSPVNSTVVFRQNSAYGSGQSIFTTTLQPCSYQCSSNNTANTPKDILNCIANFIFNKSADSSISTRPERYNLSASTPVELIPGSEYFLPLSATDETNTSVSSIEYRASVSNTSIKIDSAFLTVSNNTVKVLGEEGSKTKLQLTTFDMVVSFDIVLTECQPGYNFNQEHLKCKCAASHYVGLEGCYPDVYINQGYWIGYCSSSNRSKLCTGYCPYGYCSYDKPHSGSQLHRIPNKSSLLVTKICGPTRTNRLCGECAPGHTVHFNSWKRTCGPDNLCYLGWLFYTLSVIIPLTLLFVTVLVFKISFTTGNANCFVLYSQVLSSLAFSGEDNVQFPVAVKYIQDIVMFPYHLFNINFFALESLSYCLWKNISLMGVMMMDYVTVIYALLLVLVTIFISNNTFIRTKIFSRFRNRSSFLIHGISAFFVLSYSLAARVTFHILHFSCLYSAKNVCVEKVVYRAGHLNYFEGEHIPFAIVALFFLIAIVILPPLLLLLYPLLFKMFGVCKISETKLAYILWRAMPIQFLDSFQSSFKDKYRCFAGLYFFYRAAILAVFVTAQSRLTFYSIAQLLLTSILTVHAIIQPHKEKKHNIIDSLLFSNLCLINGITLFYYARTQAHARSRSELETSVVAVIQAVLVVLPLIIAIVMSMVNWRLQKTKKEDIGGLPSLRTDQETSPLVCN